MSCYNLLPNLTFDIYTIFITCFMIQNHFSPSCSPIKCKYIHDTRYFQTGSLKKTARKREKSFEDILGLSISLSNFCLANSARFKKENRFCYYSCGGCVIIFGHLKCSSNPRLLILPFKRGGHVEETVYTGCPIRSWFSHDFNIVFSNR